VSILALQADTDAWQISGHYLALLIKCFFARSSLKIAVCTLVCAFYSKYIYISVTDCDQYTQELVQGRTLQQMMDAGWRPAEQHVEHIASKMLAILVYLQQQQVSPDPS